VLLLLVALAMALGCTGAFTTFIWTLRVGRTLLRAGVCTEASQATN
jgi:hypothetical protein